ncbi:hypothetical protein V6N13_022842 [Hibiscus sabdariffa]|uniref:Uncharacterized protein n=1 Tax=Hibiscus sabdariffa TaxID=183260 RepID=A0ABR2BCZ6_9ROSI
MVRPLPSALHSVIICVVRRRERFTPLSISFSPSIQSWFCKPPCRLLSCCYRCPHGVVIVISLQSPCVRRRAELPAVIAIREGVLETLAPVGRTRARLLELVGEGAQRGVG